MISVFDVNRQQQKIDRKIVVALERISEAFRVLLWNESKENALSPIQIQALIFLLFHTADKCTISYLAKEFNLSKPTMSDSIKVLVQKGLVKKIADTEDSRSYNIALTASGKRIPKNRPTLPWILKNLWLQYPAKKKNWFFPPYSI